MLEVLSLCDRDTECSTSFNKDNSANFSGEKKYSELSFLGCLFLARKDLKSKLVLVRSRSRLKISWSLVLNKQAVMFKSKFSGKGGAFAQIV